MERFTIEIVNRKILTNGQYRRTKFCQFGSPKLTRVRYQHGDDCPQAHDPALAGSGLVGAALQREDVHDGPQNASRVCFSPTRQNCQVSHL